MKKKMKRFLSITLATVLCSSLLLTGGCQSKSSGTGEEKQGSDKIVTIEFLNQKREAKDTFDAMIKDFESKNPNIKIKQTVTTDASSVFSTRAASGDFPQTFGTLPTQADVHQYEKDGFYLDLSGEPCMENIQPGIREMAQLDGKDYTIPLALNTYGVMYDVKQFKEMGLSVPQTWDEMIALCEKIQKAGKTPFLFPDKDAWTTDHLMEALWGNVTGVTQPFEDAISGKSHLTDNAEVKKAAQAYLDLRKYGQKDTLGLSYDNAVSDFANGKSVMMIEGIWAIPSMKNANPNLEMSMFPLPPLEGSKAQVVVGLDAAVAASSKAKDLPEVKKWLNYCGSKAGAQIYADHDGSPSAIKDVAPSIKESQSLIQLVNKGNTYPWNSVIQTTNILSNVSTLTQELAMNKNVDQFMKDLDKLYFQAK